MSCLTWAAHQRHGLVGIERRPPAWSRCGDSSYVLLKRHDTYAFLYSLWALMPVAYTKVIRAMTLKSDVTERGSGSRRRRTATFAAVSTAALMLSLVPVGAQAAPDDKDLTFYAAPEGRDIGECQDQHPCSLDRVQEVVREEARKAKGDITVQLADGTYRIPPARCVPRPGRRPGRRAGQLGRGSRGQAGDHRVARLSGWSLHDAGDRHLRGEHPAVSTPASSTSTA